MCHPFKMNEIDNFINDTKFLKNSISVRFKENLGTFNCQRKIINDDILFYKTDIYCKESLSIKSNINISGLVISITLKGDIAYTEQNREEQDVYKNNTITISYINNIEGIDYFNKNGHYENIGIILKNSFLEKYLFPKLNNSNDLKVKFKENTAVTLKNSFENFQTLTLARQIFQSQFNNELDNIFIQSKIYEIIYNEFNDLFLNEKILNLNNVILSKNDIDSLYKVRDIINSSTINISLKKLSKKVALNEFKLKYGFKKLFDTTPRALMIKNRMEEAKRLLIQSDLNVTEISAKIGYKHQQSFSKSFLNYFGVKAKDIMNKRKYYY